ncbi:DUF6364 family protein [Leptospira sp. GIMC2001]|uniref:DUF6364 family protein n=1 Tax=Leptospira sp. GIMC2001 TaxID=1513297 RepID=UPI00234B573E|nr:DUF6364 family protein [Leptospira sp. GIMC2001]WCL50675.1 DUF6364 family protein [Leptospira sp. GIMC2001]
MNTKLTLSINEEVIQAAKDFAKKNNRSVSKLVEEYLFTLSKQTNSSFGRVPKFTKKYAGILKNHEYFDARKEITEHLDRKYK